MRSRLAAAQLLVLAVACGRTELENDELDVGDTGATGGDGGSGGRGAGGRAVSGGAGGNVGATGGALATGGVGGSFGGNGVGGSFGGSFGGSVDDGGTGGMPFAGFGGSSGAGAGGQPMAGQGGMPAGAAGMPPVGCGNGVVDPGEACDPGDDPSPPALELRQGAFRAEVFPVVGFNSANVFYTYDSASSHTGFEQLLASRLYLYRWSVEEALSLVMHHGIDEDTTGITQPESAVTFDIEGLPSTGVVALSDEPNEFFRATPTSAHADWTFRRNTDGGIIGGLPFPGSWHLVVTAQFFAGVDQWSFLSGNVQPELGNIEHGLELSVPVEIVSSEDATSCRADCTPPLCGDGRLDPGEVCDDGNSMPGDGCAGCRPELP